MCDLSCSACSFYIHTEVRAPVFASDCVFQRASFIKCLVFICLVWSQNGQTFYSCLTRLSKHIRGDANCDVYKSGTTVPPSVCVWAPLPKDRAILHLRLAHGHAHATYNTGPSPILKMGGCSTSSLAGCRPCLTPFHYKPRPLTQLKPRPISDQMARGRRHGTELSESSVGKRPNEKHILFTVCFWLQSSKNTRMYSVLCVYILYASSVPAALVVHVMWQHHLAFQQWWICWIDQFKWLWKSLNALKIMLWWIFLRSNTHGSALEQ